MLILLLVNILEPIYTTTRSCELCDAVSLHATVQYMFSADVHGPLREGEPPGGKQHLVRRGVLVCLTLCSIFSVYVSFLERNYVF